jgi:hypothetical protein
VGCGTACPFGCDLTTLQCRDLVPANQAASNLAAGDTFTCTGTQDPTLPDVRVPDAQTLIIDPAGNLYLNTVSAGTKVFGVKTGTAYTVGGHQVVVSHLRSLTVADGGTVIFNFTGYGYEQAIVLLVDRNVSIGASGTLQTVVDLSSQAYGEDANSNAPSGSSGGGGHATAGGSGGSGVGAAYGNVRSQEMLVPGGCERPGQYNGGGALQVSACGAITLGAKVVVNASGLGGSGNDFGGGGAGGTILFEGANVLIDPAGELVANGGGGSDGSSISGPGANGASWSIGQPPTQAPGGGVGCVPGAGGAGAAGVVGPTDGQPGTSCLGYGAGGGAAGEIFVNVSPQVSAPGIGNSSPPPYTSTVCLTSGGKAPTSCSY